MPVSLLVRLFFWLWFGAAIAVGHYLLLQRMPAVALQGVTLGLSALLLLVYFRVPAVRSWVNALDLRTLVLMHVTRFTGIYLILLFQSGELPRAFAIPTGVTDAIVATMALPLAFAPLEQSSRRRGIVIWNVVGLVGLLISIVAAARINLVHPMPLRALTHLPLSLLPTLLTPLLLTIHVILFVRTQAAKGDTG